MKNDLHCAPAWMLFSKRNKRKADGIGTVCLFSFRADETMRLVSVAMASRKRGHMQKQRVLKKKTVCRAPSLLGGVLFLTVANVIVKILGFFYKVPLNAILGDEMANVNAAYAVYALLYTISTAGIPGAVSLTVSRARARGEYGRVKSIFRVTFSVLFLLGVTLSALLMLLSKPLAVFNSGGDSYLCLLAIAPALAFASANSVLRGFFQGFENMRPTAVSELLEAIGKTGFGLFFAFLALFWGNMSFRTAAAFAVFGITLGVGVSALYLGVVYAKKSGAMLLYAEEDAAKKGVLRGVLAIALPITAASAMMSVSSLLDAQLMRPLLAFFYGDGEIAKTLYSDYSTGALTLYNLPSILVTPMSVALVPHVAAAFEHGEKEKATRVMETAFRASALLSLPCALGMSALASPILRFVFRGDADMADNTGALLSVLSAAVFFVAVFTVSSAALQAAKKEKLPLAALGCGLAVKLISMLVLTARFGEIGVPVSTVLFFFTVAALNLFFVRKYIGLPVRIGKTFLRPACAAFASALAAWLIFFFLFPHVGNSISLVLAIAGAVAIYGVFILLLRCVGTEELAMFPFLRGRAHFFRYKLYKNKRKNMAILPKNGKK